MTLPVAALLLQTGINTVMDQSRFARTADAGDADQHVERNVDVDAFQIVFACPAHAKLFDLERPPVLRLTDFCIAAQITRRQRLWTFEQSRKVAFVNQLTAKLSR